MLATAFADVGLATRLIRQFNRLAARRIVSLRTAVTPLNNTRFLA
jgi:hypothetical protein